MENGTSPQGSTRALRFHNQLLLSRVPLLHSLPCLVTSSALASWLFAPLHCAGGGVHTARHCSTPHLLVTNHPTRLFVRLSKFLLPQHLDHPSSTCPRQVRHHVSDLLSPSLLCLDVYYLPFATPLLRGRQHHRRLPAPDGMLGPKLHATFAHHPLPSATACPCQGHPPGIDHLPYLPLKANFQEAVDSCGVLRKFAMPVGGLPPDE